MLSSVKLYIALGLIAASLTMTGVAYYKGKSAGHAKAVAYYQPILDKQVAMVKELEARQPIINEVVVTKYLTKYVTVTETIDRIIQGTSEALSNENATCTIGPNFIRLHNAAANTGPVPGSPGAVDAVGSATEATP